MAHSSDKGVKERRLEREAAAKRRDDGFLADKQHAHDEAMAKIVRLREQRLAEAAKQPAPAAKLVRAHASKKAP
jgi:hypothetical protein